MTENANDQERTKPPAQSAFGQPSASHYPPPPAASQYPPPGPQYSPPGPQYSPPPGPQYTPPPGPQYPQYPPGAQYPPGQQFGAVGQQKPSALWPLSVISFLFSYLFGGIALYYSYQVGKRWQSGDAQGAAKASKNAMIWGIVGLVIGVIFILVIAGSGGS